MTQPSEQGARKAVLHDTCPECGHAAGWHGENHDDGCNATGGCDCGLNSYDCHRKIDREAALDAYRDAIEARVDRELRSEVGWKRDGRSIVELIEELRQSDAARREAFVNGAVWMAHDAPTTDPEVEAERRYPDAARGDDQ